MHIKDYLIKLENRENKTPFGNRQYEALHLRYVKEMNYKEVAKHMNLSPKTAAALISRGKKLVCGKHQLIISKDSENIKRAKIIFLLKKHNIYLREAHEILRKELKL